MMSIPEDLSISKDIPSPLAPWPSLHGSEFKRLFGYEPPATPPHVLESPRQRRFRLRVRRLLGLRRRLERLVLLVVRRLVARELPAAVAKVLSQGGRHHA
jgi:hypothetical protein